MHNIVWKTDFFPLCSVPEKRRPSSTFSQEGKAGHCQGALGKCSCDPPLQPPELHHSTSGLGSVGPSVHKYAVLGGVGGKFALCARSCHSLWSLAGLARRKEKEAETPRIYSAKSFTAKPRVWLAALPY